MCESGTWLTSVFRRTAALREQRSSICRAERPLHQSMNLVSVELCDPPLPFLASTLEPVQPLRPGVATARCPSVRDEQQLFAVRAGFPERQTWSVGISGFRKIGPIGPQKI